jgi:hypothetical protein
MEKYEAVFKAICRLGGARQDRVTTECRTSQITISRAIKELDPDDMIRRGKNIWYPNSAVANKAKPICRTEPPQSGPFGFSPRCGEAADSGAADQDADLSVVIGEAA